MPQSVPCGPRTFIWMLFDHWWTAERHTSFLSQPIGNALWNAYESHYISKSRGETDTENVLKLEIQEWYKYFQVPFDGQLTYFKPCSLMSHLKNRNKCGASYRVRLYLLQGNILLSASWRCGSRRWFWAFVYLGEPFFSSKKSIGRSLICKPMRVVMLAVGGRASHSLSLILYYPLEPHIWKPLE